jgi:HAD superfamily hydrolase (TIGR01509 family)
MPSFISGVLKVLDKHSIKYCDDIVKIITPLGFLGTAEYFIKEFNLEYDVNDLVEIFKDNMREDYFYKIPAKNNVIETLKVLKERGDSLNVLTASPHVTLDACLKRLGIYDLFENVWSCDDFSTTKADPGIYKRVAEKLDKETSEILFLDDNIFANQTGKQANMKTCGVYDESSSDMVEKMKETCDFYIYDFVELQGIEF